MLPLPVKGLKVIGGFKINKAELMEYLCPRTTNLHYYSRRSWFRDTRSTPPTKITQTATVGGVHVAAVVSSYVGLMDCCSETNSDNTRLRK